MNEWQRCPVCDGDGIYHTAAVAGVAVLLTEWGEAMGLLHDALERAEHDLMAVGHAPDGPARTEAMADLRKWQAKLIEFIGRMGADSTPDVASPGTADGDDDAT